MDETEGLAYGEHDKNRDMAKNVKTINSVTVGL